MSIEKEIATKLKEYRKKHLDILDYVALVDLDKLIKEYEPDYMNPVQLELLKKDHFL